MNRQQTVALFLEHYLDTRAMRRTTSFLSVVPRPSLLTAPFYAVTSDVPLDVLLFGRIFIYHIRFFFGFSASFYNIEFMSCTILFFGGLRARHPRISCLSSSQSPYPNLFFLPSFFWICSAPQYCVGVALGH